MSSLPLPFAANPFQVPPPMHNKEDGDDELNERAARSPSPPASPPPSHHAQQSPLPPSDLNLADGARLAVALGRASKLPAMIMADRDARGPFRSMHDLQQRIKGLGKAKILLLQQSGFFIDLQQAQMQQQQQQYQQEQQKDASRPQSPGVELVATRPVPAVQPSVVAAPAVPTVPAASSPSIVLPNSAPLLLPLVSSSSPTPPPPSDQTMEAIGTVVQGSRATADAPPPRGQFNCWAMFCCCQCSTDPPDAGLAAPMSPVKPPQVQLPASTIVYGYVETARTQQLDNVVNQLANLTLQPASPAQQQPHLPVGPPVPPELVARSFAPPPSSSSVPTLRVGSWNLQHFNTAKAHQHTSMRIIADVIARQRYDVVALLEVRSVDAVEMLLTAYLNNPKRDVPVISPLARADDLPEDNGCGHWCFVISDAVQYGSDAHRPLPSALAAAAAAASNPQLDVVSEDDPALLRPSAAAVAPPPTSSDAALAGSLSSLSLQTPLKKRNASNSAVTSPTSPLQAHHRRSSTGSNASGSGMKRASHKKREHYAFLYRSDRVQLPFGCRLYQTKASSAGAAAASPAASVASPQSVDASAAPVVASEYSWWRSPCYALVRPLPSLLLPSSASSITVAAVAPPLEWLLCAAHVVWGDGEFDVISECAHLQPLYCRLVGMIEDGHIPSAATTNVGRAEAAPADRNVAVALLGDFNMQAADARFDAHCLPAAHFTPLLQPPHCTTFSERRACCNLYDHIFMQSEVVRALVEEQQSPQAAASSLAPLRESHTLHAGVCYFDSLYFPTAEACDDNDPAVQCRLRLEAKRAVSDHRPVWADLPARGDVRGKASRHELQQLRPVLPPQLPPVKSAVPPSSAVASSPTNDATVSGSFSLSSLLTIVVTTSAVPIHPSTELFDAVLHSFALIPELRGVRIVVMCDAPKDVVADKPEEGKRADWEPSVFKRGVVTHTRLANYRAYIATLRARYAEREDVEIHELEVHAGFAWAVRTALEHHVHTPYVLIQQHDYIFSMPVPIGRIVATMRASHEAAAVASEAAASSSQPTATLSPLPLPSPLNYVGFVHRSTQQYLNVMTRGMPAAIASDPLRRVFKVHAPGDLNERCGSSDVPPALQFSPLLFWYDKPHVASREFYLRSVLSHPRLQPRGTFVEDEFGVAHLEHMRSLNGSGCAMQHWASTLGAYLYHSDERGLEICLRHLHGRRFEQQRIGGLYRMLAPTASSPEAESDAEDEEEDAQARVDLFAQEG